MSAIQDSNGDSKAIRVLFPLHAGFDTLDFAGPTEILDQARTDNGNQLSSQSYSN